MVSEKPEAGEWWVNHLGIRVHVLGYRTNGEIVYESESRGLDWHKVETESWKRLQNCDGWDWKDPDVFPQWITFDGERFADCAYIVRESTTSAFRVHDNGYVEPYCFKLPWPSSWKIVPESEALALLRPGVGKPRRPEFTEREINMLEAVANLRDNMDRLAKRVAILESQERRDRACAAV